MNSQSYTDGLNSGIIIGIAATPENNDTTLRSNKRAVPQAAIKTAAAALIIKSITISNDFSTKKITANSKVVTTALVTRVINYKI